MLLVVGSFLGLLPPRGIEWPTGRAVVYGAATPSPTGMTGPMLFPPPRRAFNSPGCRDRPLHAPIRIGLLVLLWAHPACLCPLRRAIITAELVMPLCLDSCRGREARQWPSLSKHASRNFLCSSSPPVPASLFHHLMGYTVHDSL